ncbi:hypothetical protein LXL04_020257 [Taraxacum kok-saghyz]
MMMHEIRAETLIEESWFRFDLLGNQVEFGEKEFCLITGFRFGAYSDILAGKYLEANSALRERLFPKYFYKVVRLKHLREYILSKPFMNVCDDDALVVFKIYLLLRGLIGRELNTSIPPLVFLLANNSNKWNRFAWGRFCGTTRRFKCARYSKKFAYITIHSL